MVPANDEIASAKTISSLPYSDSIDASLATSGDDDPGCVGNGHSVWYKFTPQTDRKVVADTFGSDYDTSLSVYSGTPGALSQVACNDDTDGPQSQVTFNATSGETYYIMVGTFVFSPAGNLKLTLAEDPSPLPPPLPPPLVQIGVSVDSTGSVSQDGTATISGTVTCAEADDVNLSATLAQTIAGRLQTAAIGFADVTCTPPSATWTMTQKSFSDTALHPGPVQVEVLATACNNVICGGDQKIGVVRLNRGK